MMGRLGKVRRAARSGAAFLPRAAFHAITGSTPEAAYQGMVNLFCLTGGVSNDVVHAAIRRMRGVSPVAPTKGILGDVKPDVLLDVGEQLRRDGYYVFPQRLPDEA